MQQHPRGTGLRHFPPLGPSGLSPANKKDEPVGGSRIISGVRGPPLPVRQSGRLRLWTGFDVPSRPGGKGLLRRPLKATTPRLNRYQATWTTPAERQPTLTGAKTGAYPSQGFQCILLGRDATSGNAVVRAVTDLRSQHPSSMQPGPQMIEAGLFCIPHRRLTP